MAGSLSARKSNAARPKLARPREASDLLDGRGDGVAVDASYGDTLRKLMPRRLSALTRSRPRAG
jgi:hypothetical protein